MTLLRSRVEDGIALIEIEGDVHTYAARELERTLTHLLAQGHKRLVLDASQMGFISSAGLQAILSAHREVCERGGEVRICMLNDQARQIIQMAGLDECLRLTNTCQEAMADWGPVPPPPV